MQLTVKFNIEQGLPGLQAEAINSTVLTFLRRAAIDGAGILNAEPGKYQFVINRSGKEARGLSGELMADTKFLEEELEKIAQADQSPQSKVYTEIHGSDNEITHEVIVTRGIDCETPTCARN
ncbi:MAG: hypothetical protein DYH13_10805 [Alphaproteobacteria bacterium PRO2]|nr:hypothetical protein [Alphaproteobacteria bacterium PRO2]